MFKKDILFDTTFIQKSTQLHEINTPNIDVPVICENIIPRI